MQDLDRSAGTMQISRGKSRQPVTGSLSNPLFKVRPEPWSSEPCAVRPVGACRDCAATSTTAVGPGNTSEKLVTPLANYSRRVEDTYLPT